MPLGPALLGDICIGGASSMTPGTWCKSASDAEDHAGTSRWRGDARVLC